MSSSGLSERFRREVTEIEFRNDLTNDEKVSRITHIACACCAGVAVQPLPFADILILTPIQAFFGSRIAAIRGVRVSESEAGELIKEIAGVIGMGVVAQQVAIGIWKTITAGMGGFMTIPIVYGLTFAIMNVIDAYYSAKAQGKSLSNSEIQEIFLAAEARGRRSASLEEPPPKVTVNVPAASVKSASDMNSKAQRMAEKQRIYNELLALYKAGKETTAGETLKHFEDRLAKLKLGSRPSPDSNGVVDHAVKVTQQHASDFDERVLERKIEVLIGMF